ncbi:3-phosphoserine/phosphohydroxythreonine transaminase [Bacteroidetes bacterium endosymbiont of Geopemphigus sp.]|uniref:3-phosphoserine/phosphohydroxythreonine transaminase n=1 Tax=Bacteroidetes bacterium endosymbiont of Geopemphigus sp. TaxID=2047937 RepID=UPI000CD2D56A|nr:3-phosphoserine/phosphohydroxythreonine transaminase [Bacteroidetes bacterium endosymbiont of Geopemphigus sp.]
MKKHNFSAGPCVLPREVIESSAHALLDFNNSGLSLIEISHRSKDFVEVMERARSLVKKIMKINDTYEVLFLQGGASLQFVMVPNNLLSKKSGWAAYLDTGTWASNAIKEAQRFGKVQIVASSRDKNYTYIPKSFSSLKEADYFHCTSNNTIYGTQMKVFPKLNLPLVCDMSSDIFSRNINFSDFDLIYAGAQKNMGPAGTTLVVVKKELLGKTERNIPNYLNYQLHIDKKSMLNTPSVFAVYTSMLTLEWIENKGGLSVIKQLNEEKAQILYEEIDRNPLLQGVVSLEDRSNMNATFILRRPELSCDFDQIWQEAGIVGLKGHRSVGGYRASMYNALSIESVRTLTETMKEFARRFT